MTDSVLQWDAPVTGYYWTHNFLYRVYRDNLVQQHLGFQETSYIADSSSDGFHFYLDAADIDRLRRPARRFFEDRTRIERLRSCINEWAVRVRALPWTLPDLPTVEEKLRWIHTLESWFHATVALHLCSQPHLLRPIEETFRAQTRAFDQTLINDLILPTGLPTVLQEQRDWYRLVLDHQKNNRNEAYLAARLAAHLEKWRFVTAGGGQDPMSFGYLHDRLDNDRQAGTEIGARLSALDQKASGAAEQRAADLAAKHLSTESAVQSLTLRECGYLRFVTKELWMKIWYLIEKMRERVADQLGMSLNGMTTEELWRSDRVDIAQDDRSSYLHIHKDGEFALFYNGRDERARAELIGEAPWTNRTSVTGDPSYPGQVVGRALVIGWEADPQTMVSLVDSDTVLVVPQTTPAFVGLLTKCKGLITDEGGIASHASIVSRELAIPSIIGTRYATRIFNTGDSILLDGLLGRAKRLDG